MKGRRGSRTADSRINEVGPRRFDDGALAMVISTKQNHVGGLHVLGHSVVPHYFENNKAMCEKDVDLISPTVASLYVSYNLSWTLSRRAVIASITDNDV
jgi:hypothetical protein